MNMKLYELKTGDKFRIVSENKFPPAHRKVEPDEIFTFVHIDGMYSLCYDKDRRYVHPVAWANVQVVKDFPAPEPTDAIDFQAHEQSR